MVQRSALELAKKIAGDKAKEEVAKKRKQQEEADRERIYKENFLKVIQDVVEQFNGVKGISVNKVKGVGDTPEWLLVKKKDNIVKLTFRWQEWKETDYDDSTSTKNGHIAQIETYPGYSKGERYYDSTFALHKGNITSVYYQSDFEKYFANVMSEFL